MFERYSPTIFFDKLFTEAVMAGWIITLVGVGILLLAAVWWTINQDSSQTSPRSGLWRGLCTIGFATFLLGIGWQLVGYVRFGVLTW
ncbi:MAG TPA: hypothetical protein VJU81_24250 [Methylomirabilota bacterium]|nr:hypothetical protein [Methylomirabilota bacterium]